MTVARIIGQYPDAAGLMPLLVLRLTKMPPAFILRGSFWHKSKVFVMGCL
jgi:hypothetical protein